MASDLGPRGAAGGGGGTLLRGGSSTGPRVFRGPQGEARRKPSGLRPQSWAGRSPACASWRGAESQAPGTGRGPRRKWGVGDDGKQEQKSKCRERERQAPREPGAALNLPQSQVHDPWPTRPTAGASAPRSVFVPQDCLFVLGCNALDGRKENLLREKRQWWGGWPRRRPPLRGVARGRRVGGHSLGWTPSSGLRLSTGSSQDTSLGGLESPKWTLNVRTPRGLSDTSQAHGDQGRPCGPRAGLVMGVR